MELKGQCTRGESAIVGMGDQRACPNERLAISADVGELGR